MDLPDLKQLKGLITMLRKEGVEQLEVDGLKLVLGAPVSKAPKAGRKTKKAAYGPTPDEPETPDGWDSLSDEQKLFYSAESLKIPTGNDGNPGPVQ